MTVSANNTGTTSDDQWTVGRVIEWTTAHLRTHGSETPRLDSEILLAHARGCARIDLYARFNEPLTTAERAAMRELVRRRTRSEPVAYLVGHREFFSLDFRVTSAVLIPRPETEMLVAELLELAAAVESPRILDVGTGSGCIAITAAVRLPAARVIAADISDAALEVAGENARRHGVEHRVRFLAGDLFEAVPAGEQFDFVVSNPPYVAESELESLQADVRLHEPRLALLAGADGLATLRRLIDETPGSLVSGGYLLVEISPEQKDAVCTLMQAHPEFSQIKITNDLAGHARVAQARRT